MKKTILITGSCKGIGFETARQLLAAGHRVILSGRDRRRLDEAVKKLPGDVQGLQMDLADEKSIRAAAADLRKAGTSVDVLINNGAILSGKDRALLQEDETIFLETLLTNCTGALRVCKAFVPLMNRPGRIINISSGGGSMTDPVGGWAPAYCVSKSLLNAITRQLAHELAAEKIRVNAACPGWVRTDMGGAGAPRHVKQGAETPVWLATEAPDRLTGKFFRDKKEIPW